MTPVCGAESTLRARDLLTCVDDDKRWALVEDIIEGLGICVVVVEMLSSISSAGRRALLRPGAPLQSSNGWPLRNPIARLLWQIVVSAGCHSWWVEKAVIGTARIE